MIGHGLNIIKCALIHTVCLYWMRKDFLYSIMIIMTVGWSMNGRD